MKNTLCFLLHYNFAPARTMNENFVKKSAKSQNSINFFITNSHTSAFIVSIFLQLSSNLIIVDVEKRKICNRRVALQHRKWENLQ
jgi:hypothetical protein